MLTKHTETDPPQPRSTTIEDLVASELDLTQIIGKTQYLFGHTPAATYQYAQSMLNVSCSTLVAILTALYSIYWFDHGLFTNTLPTIKKELHLGHNTKLLTLLGGTFGLFLSAPIVGKILARKYPPFNIIFSGFIILDISSLMVAFGSNFPILFCARILNGISNAFIISIAPPLILFVAPPDWKSLSLSIFLMSVPCGYSFGVFCSDYLIDNHTASLHIVDSVWRRIFFWESIILIPVIVTCWKFLSGPQNFLIMAKYTKTLHQMADILTNEIYLGILLGHFLQGISCTVLALIVQQRLESSKLGGDGSHWNFTTDEIWTILIFCFGGFGVCLGGYIADHVAQTDLFQMTHRKIRRRHHSTAKKVISYCPCRCWEGRGGLTRVPPHTPGQNSELAPVGSPTDKMDPIEPITASATNSVPSGLAALQSLQSKQKIYKKQKQSRHKIPHSNPSIQHGSGGENRVISSGSGGTPQLLRQRSQLGRSNLHAIRLCLWKVVLRLNIVNLVLVITLYWIENLTAFLIVALIAQTITYGQMSSLYLCLLWTVGVDWQPLACGIAEIFSHIAGDGTTPGLLGYVVNGKRFNFDWVVLIGTLILSLMFYLIIWKFVDYQIWSLTQKSKIGTTRIFDLLMPHNDDDDSSSSDNDFSSETYESAPIQSNKHGGKGRTTLSNQNNDMLDLISDVDSGTADGRTTGIRILSARNVQKFGVNNPSFGFEEFAARGVLAPQRTSGMATTMSDSDEMEHSRDDSDPSHSEWSPRGTPIFTHTTFQRM